MGQIKEMKEAKNGIYEYLGPSANHCLFPEESAKRRPKETRFNLQTGMEDRMPEASQQLAGGRA
jgi:hypothetical protein